MPEPMYVDEAIVCCGRNLHEPWRGIIQSSKDAWRSTFLDKVTYNLVVEVLDWVPLDLFPNILLVQVFSVNSMNICCSFSFT